MIDISRKLLIAALLVLFGAPASAQGLHLGWCIGVGNKHQGTDCSSGSTVPIAPQVQTPVTNAIPGPVTPAVTPTSIPTAVIVTGTLPTGVTGFGPVPSGVVPSRVVTGYVPVPNVVVTPNPPQVVTGFAPVLTPNPPGTLTGYAPVPNVVVTPNPPQVVTGFAPAFTPNPPVTVTGHGVVMTPNPPQTIVGYGPVIVANPPKMVTGFGPVPATITVYPKPPLPTGPGRVPTAVPQAVPQLVPHLIPRPRPTVGGTAVQTGGSITHTPSVQGAAVGLGQIPPSTGSHSGGPLPRFKGGSADEAWECLASGHGMRRVLKDGRVEIIGSYSHIGNVDSLARDVPARHPKAPHCVISVRRKTE